MQPNLHAGGDKPVYPGPLYIQINKLLRQRILSRSWQVGTFLPNESELAREYNVSVGTMRKALQQLEEAGWISRRQGRGTFVADPRLVSQQRMNNFHMNGERFVIDGMQYLSCKREKVSNEIARELQLSSGEMIIRIERKRLMNGIVRIFEDVFVPVSMVSDLPDDLDLSEKLFEDLFDYKTFISRCIEKVRAVNASSDIATILEIEPLTPLLECERVAYDVMDRPVELCRRSILLGQLEYLAQTK